MGGPRPQEFWATAILAAIVGASSEGNRPPENVAKRAAMIADVATDEYKKRIESGAFKRDQEE